MNGHPPAWLDDAVFYEIYPQSFCDSNGDGIGDLNGIVQKLGYIQGLGCNALWINPCFVSPFEDAGYDVADYCKIAPRYGTNADAKRLFAAAHKRGMKVLLDLVPGHTSWQHPWFQASSAHKRSKYHDWYLWTGSAWEHPGPGLESIRGKHERDASYITNFFYSQPALNFGFAKPEKGKAWQLPVTHPVVEQVTAEIKKVMRFWLDMGADGFRVDMAGAMVKNDPGQQATIKFWKGLTRDLQQRYPQAALVAEWGQPAKALRAGFDMDFLLHFGAEAYTSLFRRGQKSYFHPSGKGEARTFWKEFPAQRRGTEKLGHICIPSGNHDMVRLAKGRTAADLKVCFAFLLSMPGAPFIYYGDEIGMGYVEGLASKEGGYSRTGSRTPMQWSHAKNRGFSTADPKKLYLPTDPRRGSPDVLAQVSQDSSLLECVRALAHLRHATPALRAAGAIQPLHVGSGKEPMAYLRKRGKQRVLVILQPCAKGAELELRVPGARGLRPLMAHGVQAEARAGKASLKAKGRSFGLFEVL
jgi:maltose alpha-D-glucosyltransferase/alpha-amylase